MSTQKVTTQHPRVLVVVREGVAEVIADVGIEVVIFDWDNYEADPEGTECAPAEFADLADFVGVPVQ